MIAMASAAAHALTMSAGGRTADTPRAAVAKYNAGAWRGTGWLIDPRTAEPLAIEDVTTSVDPAPSALVTQTTLGARDPARDLLDLDLADADLDGSYSAEHDTDGGLLGGGAPGGLVIEHAIAVSDNERRRCLLRYGDGGALEAVLLLLEGRAAADDVDAPAPSTLLSICGDWEGDASVRRSAEPAAARPKGGRGFGTPRVAKARDVFDEAAGRQGRPEATSVFKSRLSYLYDGESTVVRKLGATAFGGDELDDIATFGVLKRHDGKFGEYESVGFASDASQPRLLLLPAACHVLAPSLLSDDAPFTCEFGVALEPGESFGWAGFTDRMPEQPEQDSDARRLARSTRLYAGRGRFVSGTTSLVSEV